MNKAVLFFSLTLFSASAFASGKSTAPLPDPANACNTPAAQHNPHCGVGNPIVSVSEPGALAALASGLLALRLIRNRKVKIISN